MKCIVLVLLASFVGQVVFAQKFDAWNAFAKTRFEPKYYERLGEYVFYPAFTEEVKQLEGKEITIEGFYVPYAPEDGAYIILSKFPNSQCFFCGGGGPESVVEVNFKKPGRKFQIDDLITVKGKLKLNADDTDHVNFILIDAVLIEN